MDKLKMHSLDGVERNIEQIGRLFPNAVTEVMRDGRVEHAIDFDVLRQELSDSIVEGREERYQFTWPDKKEAVLAANAPITATLRPIPEDSVGKDGTPGGFDSENLYIEGDNLEALKLLQETYLGKVKMIYIDPPYNTGNDFVYEDDFSRNTADYMKGSGQYDEVGNRMVTNTENNGRFHTDWLNMIYPRLKLAKDLLSDDGVIFISIDDNESGNLRKLCDDIFGEPNFVSDITWRRRTNQPNDKSKMIAKVSEYILVYAKNLAVLSDSKAFHGVPLSDERKAEYKNPDSDSRGPWSTNPWKAATGRGGTRYSITTPRGIVYTETWYGTKETFESLLAEKRVHWTDNGLGFPRIKIYLKDAENEGQAAINFFTYEKYGSNQEGSGEVEQLLERKGIFDNPKPTRLLRSIIKVASDKESIILDFFSGSATTAHAVMQLNAEDGGHRKFIMVQLPERTDEKSEAYKAGYRNICEIGKERIRRAGRKIKEEAGLAAPSDLDIGFRCLRLDESNMDDVYYTPDELRQETLFSLVDNVKPDRSPEDLLFQVMLDLGILLSSPIERKEISGKKVFDVADGFLLACFDRDIRDETVKAIAKRKPYYAVFRDSGMANDSVAANFDQIFETYSPDTVRKVL